MLAAALLVIPVLIIEASDASSTLRTVGDILNWAIWTAFAVEVVTMLCVVKDRGSWLRWHPLDVAIVLFTVPFLPASLQATRIFRLIRVLRITRLVRSARVLFSLAGLRIAAVLTFMTMLGGGAAFVALENRAGHHLSLWDGTWWAATTMTTVGYGDIYPTTTGGRIVALAIMAVGIGFIALVTGAIAQRFLGAEIAEAEASIEEGVALAESDVLAEIAEISRRLRMLEVAVRAQQRRPTT